MLKPNRKIPKVAAAALVVGGCGGGGGGSSAERLARSFCDSLFECDPVEFDYYYTSLTDCRSYNTSYFDDMIDYYTSVYGAACVSATVNAMNCYYSTLPDVACDYYDAYYACYDEYVDAYYACT